MSEVLEYDGDIAMVSRWAQELLGYHFSVLQRPYRMMIDVDSFTRRFGQLTSQYVMQLYYHITLGHAARLCILWTYIQFQRQPKYQLRILCLSWYYQSSPIQSSMELRILLEAHHFSNQPHQV